jgi:hypothetical protein
LPAIANEMKLALFLRLPRWDLMMNKYFSVKFSGIWRQKTINNFQIQWLVSDIFIFIHKAIRSSQKG